MLDEARNMILSRNHNALIIVGFRYIRQGLNMSGQYVAWRISPNDKDSFLAHFPGSVWSGVAHQAGVQNGAGGVFPGWTPASRDELNRVRNGSSNLANRNNLPPHRYLIIPGGSLTDEQIEYLWTCYWINDLQRPSDPGFGTVTLAPVAATMWTSGQKVQSLVAQIMHGATSIEVYYLGSKEIV
jgi:hypothetical protein